MDSIDSLSANLAKLPAKDQDFAISLIDQFSARGSLSPKQWDWVERLAQRATKPAPAAAQQVGDFKGVLALFERAREHLKHAKIRLQTADGGQVAISIAGPNSKAPGSLNVTDGMPFGESKWFGRVSPDGAWTPSQHATPELTALLVQLGADPVGVAGSYGRLTGSCCFCRQTLTDQRSTDVGYGPICAGHWGLPWGA